MQSAVCTRVQLIIQKWYSDKVLMKLFTEWILHFCKSLSDFL